MVTHLPDYCGKDNLTKFYQDQDRKKYQIGNACLRVGRKVYFFRCSWTTVKWLEESRKKPPMWKKLMKLVDLGEPTSFLDHVYLGCTQRECKSNESIIDEHRKFFRITNFRQGN